MECLADVLAARTRVTWLPSTFISPANLQPWRSERRRSQAQVLQETHPQVSLPGRTVLHPPPSQKTEGIFPPTQPWMRAGNTSSRLAARRFQRAEFSITAKVRPVRLVTSQPCRRFFASGGPCSQGPGQGLRDGLCALMDESQGGPGWGWDLSWLRECSGLNSCSYEWQIPGRLKIACVRLVRSRVS